MFVVSRRMVTLVGSILIGAVWLLTLVTAGAAGLEFVLKIRSHLEERQARTDSGPRLDKLERAYEPFGVEHLHPQYLFFLPLDPGERVRLSNETCSIDVDGFRGPGPAHAGGRQLAFLLGGSSAFGWYASSDKTTITSYLNRMQDRYFFVNAGAPAWNSTQEMFRLAFQILEYHPALVMTYDGANDAAMLEGDGESGVVYPAGTPEFFKYLAALVDGRSLDTLVEEGRTGGRWSPRGVLKYLFPELAIRIMARLDTAHVPDGATARSPRLAESRLQAGAARYLSNLARMRDLTTAGGARFIAVFQPVAQLHRHFGPKRPFAANGVDGDRVIDRFHAAVMASEHDVELHDLGSVFDEHYERVPVVDGDITDDTVFVDELHIYDPGSEIVARHLAGLLK